jgi:hypothetical protein
MTAIVGGRRPYIGTGGRCTQRHGRRQDILDRIKESVFGQCFAIEGLPEAEFEGKYSELIMGVEGSRESISVDAPLTMALVQQKRSCMYFL